MKKRKGDCYEVAGRKVMEDTHLLLCHGVTHNTLTGRFMGHAWNELGDMVFDFSNGNNIVMERKRYYKLGRIKKVRKYTSEEAMKLMLKHENFGPWGK
jgi:hypothetical protein